MYPSSPVSCCYAWNCAGRSLKDHHQIYVRIEGQLLYILFFTIFLFKGPTEDLEKLLESDDELSEAGDDLTEAGDVLVETDPEVGHQPNDLAERMESDYGLSEAGVDLAEAGDVLAETDPEASHQLNDLAEQSSLKAHMGRFSICFLADTLSPELYCLQACQVSVKTLIVRKSSKEMFLCVCLQGEICCFVTFDF